MLRYALTANAPEAKDTDFTWKDFQARNNNELVAIFGNFINRVVVLTHKYYNGMVPKPNDFSQIDKETLASIKSFPEDISNSIERYRFREAQQELMNLARLGNKYLADEEPWKVIKVDETRVQTIMYVALQISTALAILSEPFLPFTSSKLKGILGLRHNEERSDVVISSIEQIATTHKNESRNDDLTWGDILTKKILLSAGHQIGEAELLFLKIEDDAIQKQIDKLIASKKANEAASKTIEPQKETITFDDFTKLDIRVGTILEAEKMPKAKKLLVLKVDTGMDVRTIVSGIAESFTAEEVIGKKVTVLVNLAPRALRGVESQGMILMTENPEGKLVFVNPDDVSVSNGLHIS